MGIAYNTSIVRDGLVLHLDPANIKCFSGGQTTCANIITGGLITGAAGSPGSAGHTPNPNNFPAYNSINGGVFDFAGGKGMNVEEDLGAHSQFSIEIWYYKNGSATTQYFTDARNNGGQWFLSNYSNYNINYQGAAYYNFDTTYNVSNTDFINRWQHMIFTSDISGSNLYIDGTQRALVADNSVTENLGVNFRIGTRYTTSSQWTGYMGPIRIYNRTLSIAEVKQNFQAHRGRYGI
jgi:hypothetical protein